MLRFAGLIGTIVMLLLTGCFNSQASERLDATFPEPLGPPPDTPHVRELVGEGFHSGLSGHPERIIPLDIETLIGTSDTIARVRLIKVEPYIAVTTPEHLDGDKLYSAYMGFKFEVLEYLMGGNGHSSIWGMVKLNEADRGSEEEALKRYTFYLNHRDAIWDAREAVVFLSDSLPDWPSTHAPDRYALGYFESNPLIERHSIAANIGWLPLASEGDSTTTSRSNASAYSIRSKEFLMDHPNRCARASEDCSISRTLNASEGSTTAPSEGVNTVGLEELKRKIAAHIADPGLVDRLRFEKAKRNMSEWMTVRNLTATTTYNSVTLRWDEPGQAVEFVSGFRILRKTQDHSDFALVADVPSVNQERNCTVCPVAYEDIMGIEAGTEYVYLVRAITENPNNGTDAQVLVITLGTKATSMPEPAPIGMPASTATPEFLPTITPMLDPKPAPISTATPTP